jgi:hypothetical protein
MFKPIYTLIFRSPSEIVQVVMDTLRAAEKGVDASFGTLCQSHQCLLLVKVFALLTHLPFLTFSDYIPMHSSSEQNTIALCFRTDRGWERAFSCGTSVRGSSESHLEVLGITMLVFNGLRVLE